MATPATGIPARTGEGGNMITKDVIPDVLGRTAYDGSHNKIGKIGNVYVDEQTGQPEWMTVHTGMFGRRETFVPLEPAQVRDNEVLVPFDKQQIKNAPTVDADTAGHLSAQEEALMYDYYGMQQPTMPPTPPTRMAGGPATGEEMTRSEERLHVGKETREAGRAHLRKYVVTEDQQQTIPVRKEKVRLEREPISDANRGKVMAEPGISEADYEVVREEERPVVAKETVPVERVRLAKDATTEQETVGGQVREERIDADGFQEER